MLIKQEALLGKGAQAESRRGGNPGEPLCPVAHSLRLMVMGSVSGLSLADHSDSGSFLGASITRPRWTPARRILGGGRMYGLVAFSKFFWLVRACWFQVPSQALLLSDHSCRWLPWCLARVVVLDSGSPNTDPGPAHSAFPAALR